MAKGVKGNRIYVYFFIIVFEPNVLVFYESDVVAVVEGSSEVNNDGFESIADYLGITLEGFRACLLGFLTGILIIWGKGTKSPVLTILCSFGL